MHYQLSDKQINQQNYEQNKKYNCPIDQSNKRLANNNITTQPTMIKNTRMSSQNIYTDAQKDNRYQNIHKNFVLPQDKFKGESSYQNEYNKKDVDYNDLRAVMQKPKSTIEFNQFQGSSHYNDSYKLNENFTGRPENFKQPNNIKLSTEPFVASTQYHDQLRGENSLVRAQRYNQPRNQIFPKGNFDGATLYNHSYIQNQVKREHQIRPQGELKVGQGKFQGGSSYLYDYAASKNPISKPQKFIPVQNQTLPKGIFEGFSSYNDSYTGTIAEKTKQFRPQQEWKMQGQFQGQSNYNDNYTGVRVDKAKQFKPQEEWKMEGEFQGQSNYNDNYTGASYEKRQQIRPQPEWKMEGQFQGHSSYLNDFKHHENAKRSQIIPLPINKFMPEGQFQTSSTYQNNYVPVSSTRQRQIKPQGELKIGGQVFEGNSSYVNDFSGNNGGRASQKFKPKQNDIMPKGRFEGQSLYNGDYVNGGHIERGEAFRPKNELQVGGKFEGTSNYTQEYSEKKGTKAERLPLTVNHVMPEGKFEGQSSYSNTYIPSIIQQTQRVVMESELKVGNSRFEGNSHYAENYQNNSVKKQPNYAQQLQYGPEGQGRQRWNKKTSRWE